MTDAAAAPHFLDTLINALETLKNEKEFTTAEFVIACTNLLPIFDGLGSLFAAFPKQDLQAKACWGGQGAYTRRVHTPTPQTQAQSLEDIKDTRSTLRAVVDEDKAV